MTDSTPRNNISRNTQTSRPEATSTHQTGTYPSIDSTPLADVRGSRYIAQLKEEEKANERYQRLGASIAPYGNTTDFSELLELLHLETDYEEFKAEHRQIVDGVSARGPGIKDSLTYDPVVKLKDAKEAALVKKFQSFVACCSKANNQEYPIVNSLRQYVFDNHETNQVFGSGVKPDGAFFYSQHETTTFSDIHIIVEAKRQVCNPNIPNAFLGQMASYAQLVWEAQYTRLFVPVIFLNGQYMDIILFARSGYWRIPLGSFVCDTTEDYIFERPMILNALNRLLFLLCQPSDKFGHFVDFSTIPRHFKFTGTKCDSQISIVHAAENDRVSIRKRIFREVPAHRRAAFLFEVQYKSSLAVLKLSWTPVSRQPEGALYDVLHANNVEGIPTIYKSGILVREFFGYRLEYIVMEHCGQPVMEKFKSEGSKDSSEEALVRLASDVSSKICACLLQAERSGVYHRDVSAGNITVNGKGDIFLVDWGFGKASAAVSLSVKSAVERDWGIDLDELTRNEDARDGMTGTLYYMGVRVLLGRASRSIFDDLESLLYVVLGGFSCMHTGKFAADAPGFENASNKKSAFAKAGIMLDPENYPQSFGVNYPTPAIYAVLHRLYKLVFEHEGQFAGAMLLSEEPEKRVLNHELLKEIMGDNLYSRCFQQQTPSSDQVSFSEARIIQVEAETKSVIEARSDLPLTTQTAVLVPTPIAGLSAVAVPALLSLPMPAVASAFTIYFPALSIQVDGNSRASREKGSSPISPTPITRGNSSGLASGMLQLNVSFPLPQSSDHSCKRKASNEGDDDGEECRASKSKRTDSNPSVE